MKEDLEIEVVNFAQKEQVDEKRPIRYGGVKAFLGLILLGLLVYSIVVAIEWVQLPRAVEPGKVSVGILWLFFSFLIIFEKARFFIRWIARYLDQNLHGWRLAYVRCGTHGYRHIILVSPQNNLKWVTNQHKHIDQFQDCVWHGCVFPLGGWKRKPHLHVGHPHNVAFGITNTYQSEAFWRLGETFKINAHLNTVTASLEDCDGSRLVQDVWFLLRIIYEDSVIRHDSTFIHFPHLGDIAFATMRERDVAQETANQLYLELMVAEEKVNATKRFVKSKQGLEIRVWLLHTLYTWTLKLCDRKIRFTSSIDGQALLDRTRAAALQLEKLEREAQQAAEVRQRAT